MTKNDLFTYLFLFYIVFYSRDASRRDDYTFRVSHELL
jgi:hypothetical protein